MGKGNRKSYGLSVTSLVNQWQKAKATPALTRADRALALAYEQTRLNVVAEVKDAYFDLYFVEKSIETVTKNKELLEKFAKIAEASYAVGKGLQQDVLKAQLERTKLLRDTAETRQQQGSLQAQLKTLLNRPPESADIAVEKLTETPLPFSSEQLLSLVRNGNAEVSGQQQMVKSKSLGVELAKKDFLPDFNVKYAWQHTAAPFPDRYSVSFGVSIPIHRARRQNPELAQASEELNQSRREYEAQVQQTYFEVKDQYLAADTGAKVLKMYREGLIPQATATFQAGLAAYPGGIAAVKDRLVGKGYRFGTLKKPFGEYYDMVYFDMAGFAVGGSRAFGQMMGGGGMGGGGMTSGTVDPPVGPLLQEPPLAANASTTPGLVDVSIDARIAPDGTVAGVRPIAGPDLLIPAALDAVQSWRYLPYRQKDQAVEVETTISVDFRLR